MKSYCARPRPVQPSRRHANAQRAEEVDGGEDERCSIGGHCARLDGHSDVGDIQTGGTQELPTKPEMIFNNRPTNIHRHAGESGAHALAGATADRSVRLWFHQPASLLHSIRQWQHSARLKALPAYIKIIFLEKEKGRPAAKACD